MWPWIKRWLDWLMNDLFRLARTRPRGQAVYTRYEKAGLTLYDLPVPWNADAVVVEVLFGNLQPAARRKADFALRLPGREPVQPETLRPEADDRYRLLFRLPTPPASAVGELLWKHLLLSRVALPVLAAEELHPGLHLALPTAPARRPGGEVAGRGACFLVASAEPGRAGVCTLQIHAQVAGEPRSKLLMEQEVLVTDGPTVFAPGLLDVAELAKVTGFELRHKGRVLGTVSLSPVPTAALNSEGGFKPPPDFAWSTAADDELSERLGRLMGG